MEALNRRRHANEPTESGIHVHTLVRHGHAAKDILLEIHARSVAMVVMRTQGRFGVERAVLGSVANEVVRSAHCPLLLLRETDELAAAPPMRAAS